MAKVSVDKGQETKKHKRKLFAYMFAKMDLKTRMYIAYGSSMKSEKDAFDRAMMMLSHMDIDTARLDRYQPCLVVWWQGVHNTKE